MKKGFVLFTMLVLLSLSVTLTTAAFSPYENYIYPTDTETAVPDSQAYLPTGVWNGKSLGTTDLSVPEDIFVSNSRRIYIADTGNDRLLILNEQGKTERILSGFEQESVKETFSAPKGVFVDTDDTLYVADSGNDRIVVLDASYHLKRIVTLPQTPLLDGIRFEPVKVVVDHSGRIFSISPNTNKGIIGIDAQGNFTGFYGVLKTKATMDIFKYFATDAQRATMEQSVPVAYSNMALDDEGFVYTTVALTDITGSYNPKIFIRKLNPSGNDVLARNGNHEIIGDVIFYQNGDEQENSQFCDIAVSGTGCYSALDQRYGRVFTYDKDGNLLFVFGAKGESLGQFSAPVSIAALDETFYILDRNKSQIVLFKPTEYGDSLMKASAAYSNRDYQTAEEYYDRLLEMSVFSDVIYQGKANCLYQKQKYAEAMKYFRYCQNKDMYIEAFKYYRNDLIDKTFPFAMSAIVVIVLLWIVLSFLKKRKGEKHE